MRGPRGLLSFELRAPWRSFGSKDSQRAVSRFHSARTAGEMEGIVSAPSRADGCAERRRDFAGS